MPIDARNPRRRPLVAMCAALALFASAGSARADDEAPPDARIAGYNPTIEIGGNSAGTFALLALCGVIAIGVCFKNSNRSHLD